MDDDLEDCVELEGDEALILASREFEKRVESRRKSGFVQGVEAGKDQGLKEGFSSGFISGLTTSMPWAITKGKADALKACTRTLTAGATSSARPPPSSPPDLDFITSSEQEVEVWKEKKLADHRRAYQECLLTSANTTNTVDTTNTLDTTDTGEAAMEVESNAEVRLGAPVTSHSDSTTDETITHMTRGDVRSGSHVTYGELVENTEIPQLIYSLRTKLNSHLTTDH